MGLLGNVVVAILVVFACLLATYGTLIFVFKDGQDFEINALKADVAETNQLIEDINTTLSEEIETVNTTLCAKILGINDTLSLEIDQLLQIFTGVNMSIYFDLNEALNVVNTTLNQEITEVNDRIDTLNTSVSSEITNLNTTLNQEITNLNTTLCTKIMDGDTLLQSDLTTINSTLNMQISERLFTINNVEGDIPNRNIDLVANGTGIAIQPDAMLHQIQVENTGVVTLNAVSSFPGSHDLLIVGAGMISVNSYPLTSTIEIDGTALSTTLSNLQMEVNMQQMEIVNLQTNITTLESEIHSIQMMGDMIAQDLNGTTITLNMTIMDLIMDVMTLQSTVLSLQSQIDALNSNNSGVPTGTISPFGGTVIPDGYLLCDGTQYSTVTYNDLFVVVGTMYCPGPCSMGMFAVPDLRGKVPAGQGGTALSGTIGSSVGTETHTLTSAEMPSHTHTGTSSVDGIHQHGVFNYFVSSLTPSSSGWQLQSNPPTSNLFNYGISSVNTALAGTHSHTMSLNNAGSGAAHNNIQPSLIIKYIIKT